MGVHENLRENTFPPDMYISEELDARPGKNPDYLREKQALQDLAMRMIDHPAGVLPRLVDLAMELTGAVSAGLSLYEENPSPGVFRWRYLRGTLAPFEDATTPRNFSPCGVTLDRNRPVLCQHPEQFYSWISDAKIVVPEVLLVPLYLGGKEPLGTLWIISEVEKHFDQNDARVATELATFAGIALHIIKTERHLQSCLEEQETLTREMSHRVKNLFAMADGLMRLSAKGATSVSEMTKILGGRFHALASAHSLVRRTFVAEGAPEVTDLTELVGAILRPYDDVGAGSRFSVGGPDVAVGDHGLNGIALIFHELVTNAAKYGALKFHEGTLKIEWVIEDDQLVFYWIELGGPSIIEQPEASGFGSKLLNDTVKRQFTGEMELLWEPGGLRATIRLPLKALLN